MIIEGTPFLGGMFQVTRLEHIFWGDSIQPTTLGVGIVGGSAWSNMEKSRGLL